MQKIIDQCSRQKTSHALLLKHCLCVICGLMVLFQTGCSSPSWEGGPRSANDLSLPASISVSPENTGDGWSTSTPDNQGMNSNVLLAAMETIRDGAYPGVDSVVVIKNGKLVAEAYFNGFKRDTLHDLRSASKSITSALAGIAIEQGVLSTDDTLAQLVRLEQYQNPDPRKAAITLLNLLNMNTGLACDDWNPDSPGQEQNIYQTNDWIKFMLDLPMVADPGAQQSHYCTGSAILAGNIVSTRTGMALDDFAQTYLFGLLGIQNVRWRRSPDGQATGGGGLWLRPRDAAKFGQLYLNRGTWQGKQIIAPQWVDESEQSMTIMYTREINGYGLLWWKRDFTVRGGTQQAVFASGNGGNFIFLLPLENLAVVFTGSNYDSSLTDQPFEIFSQRILPALR